MTAGARLGVVVATAAALCALRAQAQHDPTLNERVRAPDAAYAERFDAARALWNDEAERVGLALGLIDDAIVTLSRDGTDLFVLLGLPTDEHRRVASNVASKALELIRPIENWTGWEIDRLDAADEGAFDPDAAARARRSLLVRDRVLPLLESRVILLYVRAGGTLARPNVAERVHALLSGLRYDDEASETRRLLALGHAAMLVGRADDARARFDAALERAPDRAMRLEAALGRAAAALGADGPTAARAALAELERSDVARAPGVAPLARLLAADARFLVEHAEAGLAQTDVARRLTLRDAWERYASTVESAIEPRRNGAAILDRLAAAAAHDGDSDPGAHGLARLGGAARLAADPARLDDAIDALNDALARPDVSTRPGVIAPAAYRLLASLYIRRDAGAWSGDAARAARALLREAEALPANDESGATIDRAITIAAAVQSRAALDEAGHALDDALALGLRRHATHHRSDDWRSMSARISLRRDDPAGALARLDEIGELSTDAACLVVEACARLWRDAPENRRRLLAAARASTLARVSDALTRPDMGVDGPDPALTCLLGAHAIRADMLAAMGHDGAAVAACREVLETHSRAAAPCAEGRLAPVADAARIGAASAWRAAMTQEAEWFTVHGAALHDRCGWSAPAAFAAEAALVALAHARDTGDEALADAVARAVRAAFAPRAFAFSRDAPRFDAALLALAEGGLIVGDAPGALLALDALSDSAQRTSRAAVLRAEALRVQGDAAGAFERLRAVAGALEHAGRRDDDYWRAWVNMLEILRENNADGSRTEAIRREVARLRLLDAALGGPAHERRIVAVERSLSR